MNKVIWLLEFQKFFEILESLVLPLEVGPPLLLLPIMLLTILTNNANQPVYSWAT